MNLKKPKFWDYPEPNYISNLLLPISKLVQLLSVLKKKQKNKLDGIKSICVGNIYLGGTGKTSLSIEFKKLFDELNVKSCFIKKEYSNQIDEQKLLSKFGKTFINKSRLQALKDARHENYEVAIFDDGLQDPEVFYELTFACFNKKNFIGNGRIIPAGPLREPLKNIKNYNNVFFVGNDDNNKKLENFLGQKYPTLSIYDSKYQILNLEEFELNDKYVIFSGIGNHNTFVETLKKNKFKIIKNFEFPDHYSYKEKDIKKIINFAKKDGLKILTTEKDYLRLNEDFKLFINFVKIKLEIIQIEKIKNKFISLISNENN